MTYLNDDTIMVKDPELRKMAYDKKEKAEIAIKDLIKKPNGFCINDSKHYYHKVNDELIIQSLSEENFMNMDRTDINIIGGRIIRIEIKNDLGKLHSISEPAYYQFCTNEQNKVSAVHYYIGGKQISTELFERVKKLETMLNVDKEKFNALMDVAAMLGGTFDRDTLKLSR